MTQLAEHARAIWQAGVDAVDSEKLVSSVIHVTPQSIQIGSQVYELTEASRILVVGAGKAGSGMASGVVQALQDCNKPISGWVNVPEDCVRSVPSITLHGARPAGINEPTRAGVTGTNEIIRILQSAQPEDLCICLISGGGSALLPSPIEGISLQDKQTITRQLSAAGANIAELNAVRKKLSRVKGGGLAQFCTQSRLSTLIISDVLGDPLDIIASGPTVSDPRGVEDAINTIESLLDLNDPVVTTCLEALRQFTPATQTFEHCHTQIIGNLETAVYAASDKAQQLGYLVESIAHQELEGLAEEVGQAHASKFREMTQRNGKHVYISGGEPVVQLAATNVRGRGGRNQQLVLAALIDQITHHSDLSRCMEAGAMLSGGTDGEDGPTDAAGALIDQQLIEQLLLQKLDTVDFLRRNDAYSFFKPLGGLLCTGPTHTNVCDLRVVLVDTAVRQ